jgi:hypothetical protein|tara:strand:+ start:198 stop:506 length:309 start_codon:yes stop_codon:yes gene_type:complete
MTTPTTLKPLHNGYLALCLDAAAAWDHPWQTDLQPLINGRQQVAWTGPGFEKGHDNKAASSLLLALARQAGRYAAEGLEISASDCWWLISHLRAETLTVISA